MHGVQAVRVVIVCLDTKGLHLQCPSLNSTFDLQSIPLLGLASNAACPCNDSKKNDIYIYIGLDGGMWVSLRFVSLELTPWRAYALIMDHNLRNGDLERDQRRMMASREGMRD